MIAADIASEYKKVGNARGYQGYTVTCGGGLAISESRILPLKMHI